MRLIVLSSFGPLRSALCGMAAQEGFDVAGVESVEACSAAIDANGAEPAVVLLDAMHDAGFGARLLPIAQDAGIAIALLCGAASDELRHHPGVRYCLVAPFAGDLLRTFLRSLHRRAAADRPTSETRTRAQVDPALPGAACKKP